MSQDVQDELPRIEVRVSNGKTWTLYHGDVIGRLPTSAHVLDDPRICELHAALTIRPTAVYLRGLQGFLQAGAAWERRVLVRSGQRIHLAQDIHLDVIRVVLPEEVVTLKVGNWKRVVLDRDEWSILPEGRVLPGYHPEAVARLWRTETSWRCAKHGGEAIIVEPGSTLSIGDLELRWGRTPVANSSQWRSATNEPSSMPAITMTIRHADTEVEVDGLGSVQLVGKTHDILRCVARRAPPGGTMHWSDIAAELWPAQSRPRQNWDGALSTLRRQFKEKLLPAFLLRAERGHIGLGLREQDTLDLRDEHL